MVTTLKQSASADRSIRRAGLAGFKLQTHLSTFNQSKRRINCGSDAAVTIIVQELCESRGGRPGLSVLTSLLVSVDVKLY